MEYTLYAVFSLVLALRLSNLFLSLSSVLLVRGKLLVMVHVHGHLTSYASVHPLPSAVRTGRRPLHETMPRRGERQLLRRRLEIAVHVGLLSRGWGVEEGGPGATSVRR